MDFVEGHQAEPEVVQMKGGGNRTLETHNTRRLRIAFTNIDNLIPVANNYLR